MGRGLGEKGKGEIWQEKLWSQAEQGDIEIPKGSFKGKGKGKKSWEWLGEGK